MKTATIEGSEIIGPLARIFGYLKKHWRVVLWGLVSLVVTDLLGLIPPWLVKDAIDSLPQLEVRHQLLPYLGLILLVVSGQAVFRFLWRKSLFGASRQVEYQLRNDLFRHVQKLDRTFFSRYPVGDLMSRCTNDLVAIQEFIAYAGLVLVDSSLIIVMALVLMTLIDPLLTLVAMVPMPLLSIVFLYFGRRVRVKASQVQEELGYLTHEVQESLTGIRVIQAYTLESVRKRSYETAVERYIGKNLQLAGLRGIFYASLTFLAGLAALVVLWFGGARVIQGHLTLGGFVAFNSYLIMLTWPMMSLGFMVNLIQRGRASLERLDEVFDQKPSVEDPPHPVHLKDEVSCVSLDDVSFRHPGSDRWALLNISLSIPSGSRVGITGPVGSGKTTLLELIPRVFDPSKGSISLDGHDLREFSLEYVRQRIALVAQEPFLFSDTIAENILFPAPDRPDMDVAKLARFVCLDKDQDSFPRGWETFIGERGVMVSGGQRQRIALARALINSPQILLLDDAFAHLDEETETLVLENLLQILPQSTILFTSHRVSSLKRADRILVLEGGRLIQDGAPATLALAQGYFQRICYQQELFRDLNRFAEKRDEEGG